MKILTNSQGKPLINQQGKAFQAPSGGGGTEIKDVNFYDYDGTLLHTYTAQEFAALSAHPANPTHEGLTAQGWNWTLADAKAFVAAAGKLHIGQTYTTSDGKTRIYITIDQSEWMSPTLYFSASAAGNTTIDWGDNSPTETSVGGENALTHTYAAQGSYVITLAVASGTTQLGGAAYAFPIISGSNEGRTTYKNMVKKIEIGSSVSLRNYFAYGLSSLSTITIPTTVTSFSSNTFTICSNLLALIIPSSITSSTSSMCDYCASLSVVCFPREITAIAAGFRNCASLKSIVIPDGVSTNSNNAFSYSGLKEVTVGGIETVNNIFTDCKVLEIAHLAEGIKTMGGVFAGCSSLRSIRLPNSLTALGNTFNGCASLQSIEIPNKVSTIGGSTFYQCYSLGSLTIPDSVTDLSNALNNCPNLKSIHLPADLTILGNSFFDGCNSVQSLTIPSGVTSIGNYALRSCNSLSSLTIPDKVTSIGTGAISGNNLKSLYMTSSTPPALAASGSISGASDLVIYVPAGSLSAYQTATNWSSHASKMQEYTPQTS